MRFALLLTLLLAACFDPRVPSGAFLCAAEPRQCPPGLSCQNGVCGGSSGVDGGVADAPLDPVDARRVDARVFPDAPRLPDGGCAPGTFVQCQSEDVALFCAAGGTFEVRPCAFQCNPDERRCEQCDPQQSRQCVADTLVTCSSDGEVTATMPCVGQTFCHAPEGRCAILSPTNLPADVCDSVATRPRTITADIAINTDSCDDGVKIAQGGGAPTICMLRYTSFVIESGVVLGAVGKNALAIVATGTMDINGDITVSALGPSAGAGAVETGAGGVRDDRWSNAGGGGGGGTHGAAGGTEDVLVTVPGGAAYGNDALSPLVGGSPGGRGGVENSFCQVDCPLIGRGGGGGGAVQLVACRTLRFAVLSSVAAAGGGGEGGFAATLTSTQLPRAGGGGGGGSGGAILIEAPTATAQILTFLYATGGGGGGGGALGPFESGGDGGDGEAEQPGSGGFRGAPFAGRGGAGGSLDSAGNNGDPPVDGETVQEDAYGAGAGGGAAGRIRINTRADVMPGTFPGSFFPFPTVGVVKVH